MYLFSCVILSVLIAMPALAEDRQIGDQRPGLEILVWKKGRAEALPAASAAPLAESLVRAFADADDLLRYLVTPDLLAESKRRGAVELVLDTPRTTTVRILGRAVALSRLLVPIDAESAAPGQLLIYFGDPGYGEFNVVVLSDEVELTARLRGALGAAR